MNDEKGLIQDTCISACISTCEKGIYETDRMELDKGVNMLDKPLDPISFENACSARELGLEDILTHHEDHQHRFTTETNIENTNLPIESLPPTDYFTMADPYVSELLVSPKNFSDILAIANRFPSGVTDFLGFECHLNGAKSRADWALAISGMGKARYVLADFLNNGGLPQSFRETSEWNQIRHFTKIWTDPHSILHEKVLGTWLEFDMLESSPSVPVPSIFFNPANINGNTASDPSQYEWFTQTALPLLTGHPLPKVVERNVNKCIQKMPDDASLDLLHNNNYHLR